MLCWISGRLLNERRLIIKVSDNRIRMVSLDTTGCLECGKWHQLHASGVFGAGVATLIISETSRLLRCLVLHKGCLFLLLSSGVNFEQLPHHCGLDDIRCACSA